MASKLIPLIPDGSYVYEVIVGGIIRYVGKGTGRRFKNHITTAKRYERYLREGRRVTLSPFYEKLLIEIGRGADICYNIVEKFDSGAEALSKEIEHIASFPVGQLWNDGPGGNGGTSGGAFKRWASLEQREAHRKRLSEVWSDPQLRAKHRERCSHIIHNLEVRSKSAHARWSRPGERERQSEFTKRHREFREAKKRANLHAGILSFGA
jgi:hypothetical protein